MWVNGTQINRPVNYSSFQTTSSCPLCFRSLTGFNGSWELRVTVPCCGRLFSWYSGGILDIHLQGTLEDLSMSTALFSCLNIIKISQLWLWLFCIVFYGVFFNYTSIQLLWLKVLLFWKINFLFQKETRKKEWAFLQKDYSMLYNYGMLIGTQPQLSVLGNE